MSQTIILTPEGAEKLRIELEYLKKERRNEISERIKSAKEYGDLSENAEYHEAKEEQAFIEGRILEVEQILKIADIVETQKASEVSVGSTVHLERNGAKVIYHIVGATESDPLNGKISLESPLGQALLGKKRGDSAQIETPNGTVVYTVTEVA